MTAESPRSDRRPNRLAGESSPYLLQHQYNPVDWYPWGTEAFERARREDKPIFLSVGYSTCYWCHVMERQSFENEAVAAVMNELFVNIKVDREERPDVDQLYMTGVQVQTHHGGWPMSVFLTPDLQYFYGGTYFPPEDRYGRPGFVSLLRAIDDAWKNRRGEVLDSAAHFTALLKQLAEPPRPAIAATIDASVVVNMLDRSMSDYDALNGGFGGQPKFPRQTLLELLLFSLSSPPLESRIAGHKSQIHHRLRHALDAMAHGGIRDQLGGGFHRYSTDARWLIPHFEIMLYDNATLGQVYAEAAGRFDEPGFATIARGVFDFVLREMTSPHGTFCTAVDAEVDAKEGEPYLWTASQIEAALGVVDAALFNRVYGLDSGPNFSDPHGDDPSPHANVLYVADRVRLAENPEILADMRRRLLAVRSQRKQPRLDTKVITSWNALMIGALARGGAALSEPAYIAAAGRAASWLLAHHRTPSGGLWRTSRDGVPTQPGCLEDYAFLAEALLELEKITNEPRWRESAGELAGQMMRRFHDDSAGGFYFSDAAATDLIVRQKTAGDSPLPSGYAVAMDVMRRLGRPDIARRAVEAMAGPLLEHGQGMSRLVQSAAALLADGPIVIGAAEHAASRSTDPAIVAKAVVDLSIESADAGSVTICLRIADGWHIQANPAAEGFVATRIILPETWTRAGARVAYPTGAPMVADGGEAGSIAVYQGEVRIAITMPGESLQGDELGIEYQACDDRSCLPPVTKHIKVPPREQSE